MQGQLAIRAGDFVVAGGGKAPLWGRVEGAYVGKDGTKKCILRKYVLASQTRYGAEKPASEIFLAVVGPEADPKPHLHSQPNPTPSILEDVEEPVEVEVDLAAITSTAAVVFVPAKDPAPVGLAPGEHFCRNGYNEESTKLALLG